MGKRIEEGGIGRDNDRLQVNPKCAIVPIENSTNRNTRQIYNNANIEPLRGFCLKKGTLLNYLLTNTSNRRDAIGYVYESSVQFELHAHKMLALPGHERREMVKNDIWKRHTYIRAAYSTCCGE